MKVIELKTIISLFQSERLLSIEQRSKLQHEIFQVVLIDLKNNSDISTLAQNLERLVTRYIARLQIDWIDFSQSILNDVASILLTILSSMAGGFSHNDNIEFQLLSQLPIEKYTKIVQIANNLDKTTALINLQNLFADYFSIHQTRSNFDDIADDLLDHLNHILPQLKAPLVD